ncbi:MAG: 50S ribosomal protein L32e, partial [Nitrososphaerota archaeon]|nr:50S ribosomal protein L32e [Nitrososphaerota archaeon]
NVNDLEKLDPKTDGVRIGHSVGTKKRTTIIVKAIEKKFKVFNARVSAVASKS